MDLQKLVQGLLYAQFPFGTSRNWPYMLTTAFALFVLVNGRRYPWAFAGLGGFLLGRMIAGLALRGWDVVAVFAFSAGLAVAFGALARVAQRPLVILASFLGVGFLAYTLCGVLRLASPWDLIASAAAGAIAVALLFAWSFDRALVINSSLAAAGLVIAASNAWIIWFPMWHGWPGVILGAIAAVVGIIHQNRELPASETADQLIRAAGQAS